MAQRIPKRRLAQARGAAMVEYILLLMLFTIVAVPGVARLREGTGAGTRSTAARIGGTPVGTTPPPTTRPPVTTTTAPPSNMVVDAGPDRRVAPGTAVTQDGTITSPGNPVQSFSWLVNGADPAASGATVGPATGTAESRGTSVSGTPVRPGRYYLTLSGTNLSETKSDLAEIKVTSGRVSIWPSTGGWYNDASNTTWHAWGGAWLGNQFGEEVNGVTISYRFTASNGSTANGTCVTSGGWCAGNMWNLPASVSWVDFQVTGLSWECLDSHDPFPAPVRTARSGLTPVTTTTTTRPAATTTTRPPATTTTTRPPATTTTRRGGPNG